VVVREAPERVLRSFFVGNRGKTKHQRPAPRRAGACPAMILLLDVGNTTTHVGLANSTRVSKRTEFSTELWKGAAPPAPLAAFVAGRPVTGVCHCSVVPRALGAVRAFIRSGRYDSAQLSAKTLLGLDLRYPLPQTLGADRLANALAAVRLYGPPLICVSFGTAVTIDAVDSRGRFVGGIIAPGLALFRDYLHEKTARLPKISLRPARRFIGRGTEEAMRAGCMLGFQGMIGALIRGARAELGTPQARVVATGGYARLAARTTPEINVVRPGLALEGLRFFWFERARLAGG
jgi:type III pantothenate kinase